jgi:hypothetical protein
MYPHYTYSNNIIYRDLIRVASYDNFTPEQMDAQTAYLQNLSNLSYDAEAAAKVYNQISAKHSDNAIILKEINRKRLLKQGKIAEALKL